MLSLGRNGRSYHSRWFLFVSNRYCHNQIEEWRDIAQSSRHQVSTLGRIKNKLSNRVLYIDYDRRKERKLTPQISIYNGNKVIGVSIARTVLSTFCPVEVDQNNTLFAVHLDGDKYNNKLSNLTWSECHVQYSRNIGCHKVPITCILLKNNKIWHFGSRIECKSYFNSLNFNIHVHTISNLCRNKSQKFGHSFSYSNESMYQRKLVSNLNGEVWKLCGETSHGTKYFVSNQARIKSRRRNENEKLMTPFLSSGYIHLGLGTGLHRLHTIVAKHWVVNPNNYSMVDHIDTNVENNHPSNLRWVSSIAENHNNQISRINKSIDVKVQQISLVDDKIIKVWDRASVAANELGIRSSNIFKVCRG
eukprot:198859_1